MPEDMLRRSTVTGIEIDPLTARIAKALYPDADIRAQPFEQSKLADGFTTSPFPTSRLATTPFTTRAGTVTNFPSTIISLPPRWTKCVRVVAHVHHVARQRWTNSTRRCVNCCPRARNCSARFVCPTMPSRRTPARKSRPTSSCSASSGAGKRPPARHGKRRRLHQRHRRSLLRSTNTSPPDRK